MGSHIGAPIALAQINVLLLIKRHKYRICMHIKNIGVYQYVAIFVGEMLPFNILSDCVVLSSAPNYNVYMI